MNCPWSEMFAYCSYIPSRVFGIVHTIDVSTIILIKGYIMVLFILWGRNIHNKHICQISAATLVSMAIVIGLYAFYYARTFTTDLFIPQKKNNLKAGKLESLK